MIVVTVVGCILVAIVIAALAAWIASDEAAAAKEMYGQVGRATTAASNQMTQALTQDLDDVELATRLSGATEVLHSIPQVMGVERRSGFPAVGVAVAGLVAVAAALLAVASRVEDRRQLAACAESAASLRFTLSSPTSTASVPLGEPGPAPAPTTAGGGLSGPTGATTPPSPVGQAGPTGQTTPAAPGSSTTTGATTTTSPAGSAPAASDAARFLEACRQKATAGEPDAADLNNSPSSTKPQSKPG